MTVRVRVEGGHGVSAQTMGLLESIAESLLRHEGLDGRYAVDVCFADAAGIRRVNREQRGADRVTDVLSFPGEAFPGGTAKEHPERLRRLVEPETGYRALGDILICLDKVQEQARAYGHSPERELGYLFAHGVCHLLGYDHCGKKERVAMRALEEMAMSDLGLTRDCECDSECCGDEDITE
ncbi:MAG: rRNA maturation RNase YbeY [Oscillospiraceae bacterium]|jgi:probable rRNA maturation factor|nr:rRNA maturation RNase YbeY [Oscillospiraceae bacterium]